MRFEVTLRLSKCAWHMRELYVYMRLTYFVQGCIYDTLTY